MKPNIRIKNEHISILLISIAALILRILVRDFTGMDMSDCLIPWYNEISAMGVKEALTTQVGNYNFLYQLIILILTKIPGETIYKYKILSVTFDYVLAAGIYAFAKKLSGEKKAVLAYAITLFLPTVWIDSACWGQCDSIYVSFIVWSLYFLYSDRVNLSFIFLGISLAFKLQAVFILPFFGFVFLYGIIVKEKKIRLYHFAISLGTVVATALPNLIAGRPLSDMIRIYKDQTETYTVIAKNYQSIWNLFRLSYDSDSQWCIGFTCLALIALMVFFYMKKADVMGKHFIWIAFLMSYTCVMFLPAMHERYGFLYEILVLIIAVSYAPGRIAALAFQLISLETYLYFLFATPLNIEFLSLLNVLVYTFVIYVFYRELEGNPLEINLFSKAEKVDDKVHAFAVKENFRPGKKDYIAMIFLTGAFLIIGSMHLGKNKAPETYEMFGPDTEQGMEVYVTLNALQDVSSVCIYPMMSGSSSLSFMDTRPCSIASSQESIPVPME